LANPAFRSRADNDGSCYEGLLDTGELQFAVLATNPELDGSWRARGKAVCADQAAAERQLLRETTAIYRRIADRPAVSADRALHPAASGLPLGNRHPRTPVRAAVSTS